MYEMRDGIRYQKSPGRYEGEPIFVQHFEAASGYADSSIYDEAGEMVADLFVAPFNLDTLDEVKSLEELNEAELAYLSSLQGTLVWYRSDGFVSFEPLVTMADLEAARRDVLMDEFLTVRQAIAAVSQAWNDLIVNATRRSVSTIDDPADVVYGLTMAQAVAIVDSLQPGGWLEPLADALGKLFTARDEEAP